MVMADIKATRAGQEKMEAAVSSNWSNLQETMKIEWRTSYHLLTNGHRTSARNSMQRLRNAAGLKSSNNVPHSRYKGSSRAAESLDPRDSNQYTSNEDPSRNHTVWNRRS